MMSPIESAGGIFQICCTVRACIKGTDTYLCYITTIRAVGSHHLNDKSGN